MGLCPDRETREAMTDGEFWEYVLLGIRPGDPRPDDVDDFDPDQYQAVADLTPCVECGELGPCAYDDQARPLVHLIVSDDDQ